MVRHHAALLDRLDDGWVVEVEVGLVVEEPVPVQLLALRVFNRCQRLLPLSLQPG